MILNKNKALIIIFALQATGSCFASEPGVDAEIDSSEHRVPRQTAQRIAMEIAIGQAAAQGALSGVAVSAQQEIINRYENSQNSPLKKVGSSINRGVYTGIEALAADLTVKCIMVPLDLGWNLLTSKSVDKQEKLNNQAIEDFNKVAMRLGQLKSLQSHANNEEIIGQYQLLIDECNQQLEEVLKKHLLKVSKKANNVTPKVAA